MYIEFIIAYVGIGFLAVLLIAVIALQCSILKKINQGITSKPNYNTPNSYSGKTSVPTVGGIAVCTRCGKQYDSRNNVCPNCGNPR